MPDIKEIDGKKLAELEGQYLIEDMPKEDVKRREDSPDDIPPYRVNLELNGNQIDALTDQFKEEFEALKEERRELGLPEKWQSLDNQYDGAMLQNERLAFNLHLHQSKIKADAISRAIKEAFLETKPMIDVSPRPDEWRMEEQAGFEVSGVQQQFICYEMDENIRPEQELSLIALCSVKKFVGIGKIEWRYNKEKRRREETYEGNNEPVVGNDGSPTIGPDGMPLVHNQALTEFENNYPNWERRGYGKYWSKIQQGKTINIVVNYFDTTVNCAKLKHIDIENFYVKNSTRYYEGLKTAHLIVERDTMTWYELEKKARNDEFDEDAVESLKEQPIQGDGGPKQTWRTKDYPILEATTYFRIEEDDEEETKIKAWFAETGEQGDTYTFLGAIVWPYYGFDTDYLPFYVKLNNDGFYGGAKSVMADLKDSNVAQDALINLALHGAYVRTLITPIVPTGSDIAATFIENRFEDGRPIEVDQVSDDINKAIGFVQYPPMDMNGLINLGNIMQRNDDYVTGVQPGMSGRENPSDPHAPAAKTIALLNQASINIRDYIKEFLPTFEMFISSVLQLYYQMSGEGRRYRVQWAAKEVTGHNPFETITRDQLVARTNIQSRAAAFCFDKTLEKQEAMMAYQAIMQNPIVQTMPDVQFKAFKIFLRKNGNEWYDFAQDELPSPKEFEQRQMQTAIKAVMAYAQQIKAQAQITGQPPGADLQALMQMITRAQMMQNNPMLAQEMQKQQQKQGNQGAPVGV